VPSRRARMRMPWPPVIPEESCRGSKSSNRKSLLRLTKRRSGHRRLPAKKTHWAASKQVSQSNDSYGTSNRNSHGPGLLHLSSHPPSRGRFIFVLGFIGRERRCPKRCDAEAETIAICNEALLRGPSRSCHVLLGASPPRTSHTHWPRAIGTAAQRAAAAAE